MRIGIYDPYLDDLGGGEKYMMTAAECLSRNHTVTIFWDNKDDLDMLKERFFLSLDNVNIKKNIFSSKVGLSSKKLFLHIQQPLGAISILSWKSKIKLSRVTNIFYNSKFTKAFNDKIFTGIKSRVIYPPVKILAKNLEKENIIIHVGRFRVINVNNDDYKKQQVMIDTFKKMVDKGLKHWKFIMAVSVNDEPDFRFKKMLNSAKSYPIEFLVNKSNKELWDFYNKAKIYWHASGFGEDLDIHPEYAEHFGISTVEAMGAGAVPVVINAGGQKEIVTDKKNGFLWNDLDELMKKTNLLINDSKLLNKMSTSAKLRSKDFGTEKFSEALEAMLI